MNQSRSPMVAPRFASVGGGYDALLAPPIRQPRLAPPVDHRRCSSVTCSSTGSSYLERRGSAMVMPCLPPPPSFPRHAAYDEPWDLYYPIDIQVSRNIRDRNSSSRGSVELFRNSMARDCVLLAEPMRFPALLYDDYLLSKFYIYRSMLNILGRIGNGTICY